MKAPFHHRSNRQGDDGDNTIMTSARRSFNANTVHFTGLILRKSMSIRPPDDMREWQLLWISALTQIETSHMMASPGLAKCEACRKPHFVLLISLSPRTMVKRHSPATTTAMSHKIEERWSALALIRCHVMKFMQAIEMMIAWWYNDIEADFGFAATW